MSLPDVRLLLEIARFGSFAQVARTRDVDPAWISRKVAEIEGQLGFRLFQRTTRRLSLTEAGDIYLRQTEAIIDAHDRARDDALSISQGAKGRLRMTATVAFAQKVLVPLIPQFRALHPGVELELLPDDGNLDMVGARIDLALRLGPGVAGDFVVSKLCDTQYRLCASPDYLARHGRPDRPEALAAHQCLRFTLPGLRDEWRFRDQTGAEQAVAIGGPISASGALALHGLALAGMGPVLLAGWLVDDDIAAGRLIDLFPDREVTPTTFETAIWMLYPSRSYLPRKVRAMIDFLRARHPGRNRAADLSPKV